jgi:diguanylate cyclase (GGDEF)-like protein
VTDELAEEHPLFLSVLPAGRDDQRVALAVVLVSTVVFLATAPFAQIPIAPLPAFIPIYESALVINDLITAVFLFGQFNISRSRALLLLACGYLFTAFVAVSHALTFPGLFSPTGLLGAGPQSTAWLYMFWHGGFPLLVIAYARCRDEGRKKPPLPGRADVAIVLSVGAVLVAVGGFTLLATAGHDALPAIMRGNRYTPVMIFVVSSIWLLSLFALLLLAHRRPYSVLDLWLMVALCAWLFDIALSAVLNAGRYDLGFYAGRIYGLLATSFVLVVLLLDNSRLYARLIKLHASDREKAAELQRLTIVDPLTGIANRRAFEEALDQEGRTQRHRTPLCLLMIDVDYFKRFNDAYGHVAGDHCLRTIAEALARTARRAGEVAARYGGEEFAVLLPHTDLDEALQLAQRMCQAVRDLNIPHKESAVAPYVTISVGVASELLATISEPEGTPLFHDSTQAGTRRSGPTVLVKTADDALYRAKTAGRNRALSAATDDVTEERADNPTADGGHSPDVKAA